ncbi:hypothetical protein [Marivirga arenosa]|uniref:Uncharacterized protein n=1 Tax=Marivirga arenosa TaxID=3059076 RepID=A0AA49JAF3_9BACT|nr:hypothetical protein [Marivirga sp. BKB1-2]WKK81760.2 hypothetical protein QYS47_05830 [Marivirga sp. BKB1-2]
MNEIYRLNRSISSSDRKYDYNKVKDFLLKQQLDQLELGDEPSGIYSKFSTEILCINKSMFNKDANYTILISNLNAIQSEVKHNLIIDKGLKIYITVELLPKLSYCLYKLGKYEQAEQVIREHLVLSEYLINRKATFVFFNLLEQILNLNKVLIAQNKVREALSNWQELFKFMIMGQESKIVYLNTGSGIVNTGLPKILKEYSILNFLKVYIAGQLEFGVYPTVNVIFRDWFNNMDVSTSERLAIYRYISILEANENGTLNHVMKDIIEFSHVFEGRNYLILRHSLNNVLIEKIEKEYSNHHKKAEMIDFIKDSLKVVGT